MLTDTLDIDLSKVKQLGNRLLAQLDALREAEPIYWSAKQSAWIVTGHAEVVEALSGGLSLSVDRLPRVFTFMPDPQERAERIPYVIDIVGRMLLSQDPPEQTRKRRLMMKAFSRPVAESYREYARTVIQEAFDEAIALGELDWVEHVARRVAGRVIIRLMGLTDDYLYTLRDWATATLGGLGGGGTTKEMLDGTQAAFLAMRDTFMVEINARRANPGDDFISALITAEIEGERLTDDDIVSTCIMCLIAGHDTTGNTMGLGTVALAHDRDAWEHFRNPQENLLDSVMELQRYVAMSTTQGRVVSEDFDWQGHAFRKGQIVYLMLAGANRDPKVFENPGRLDFDRPQSENVVFGPGLHHCIGHLLAKMQLTEFFPALVDRFEKIEILDEELDWSTVVGFRGLHTLNVRVTPRASH